jgi:hypothetical protein
LHLCKHCCSHRIHGLGRLYYLQTLPKGGAISFYGFVSEIGGVGGVNDAVGAFSFYFGDVDTIVGVGGLCDIGDVDAVWFLLVVLVLLLETVVVIMALVFILLRMKLL